MLTADDADVTDKSAIIGVHLRINFLRRNPFSPKCPTRRTWRGPMSGPPKPLGLETDVLAAHSFARLVGRLATPNSGHGAHTRIVSEYGRSFNHRTKALLATWATRCGSGCLVERNRMALVTLRTSQRTFAFVFGSIPVLSKITRSALV